MPDLPNRLRVAVDTAEPVTLDEVVTAARRRRFRRASMAAVAAVAVVAAAIVVPLSLGSHRAGPTTLRVGPAGNGQSAAGGPPATATATHDGVTATVTLDTAKAATGTGIGGHLVIDNRTGHPLAGMGAACADQAFRVGLSDGRHSTFTGFFARGCIPAFTFPTGSSTQAFIVSTVYVDGSGAHALPSGRYQATLRAIYFSAIPIPAPINVTLTGRPDNSTGPATINVPTGPPSTATARVTVPVVVGRPQASAMSLLGIAGLRSSARTVSSVTVSAGDVIAENPPPGTTVSAGSTVTVYVSSGPNGPGGTIPTISGVNAPTTVTLTP